MNDDNLDQQLQAHFSQADEQNTDEFMVKNIMLTIEKIDRRRTLLLRIAILICTALAIAFVPLFLGVYEYFSYPTLPLPLAEISSNSTTNRGLIGLLSIFVVSLMLIFYSNAS